MNEHSDVGRDWPHAQKTELEWETKQNSRYLGCTKTVGHVILLYAIMLLTTNISRNNQCSYYQEKSLFSGICSVSSVYLWKDLMFSLKETMEPYLHYSCHC